MTRARKIALGVFGAGCKKARAVWRHARQADLDDQIALMTRGSRGLG